MYERCSAVGAAAQVGAEAAARSDRLRRHRMRVRNALRARRANAQRQDGRHSSQHARGLRLLALPATLLSATAHIPRAAAATNLLRHLSLHALLLHAILNAIPPRSHMRLRLYA